MLDNLIESCPIAHCVIKITTSFQIITATTKYLPIIS